MSKNIVILTGAGISAESGVSTFRENGGLWCQHKIEDVATPKAFEKNPQLVHDFYNRRRNQLKEVCPNSAHLALAELEKNWNGNFLLVTQNVDNLHERAGSVSLIHMHGILTQVRCIKTHKIFSWNSDCSGNIKCACCSERNNLRPNIVWFGEMPFKMDIIYNALAVCDIFISIGTSGAVYPAAGFVEEALNNGKAHTVEINLEPSEGSYLFAEKLHGQAGQLVPQYTKKLLQQYSLEN